MSQIVLNVDDQKLSLFLDLLGSLDYVRIVSNEKKQGNPPYEVEGTSFTEADYMYGFGIMKDKPNFTLEKIRKKSWQRKW